MEEKFTCFLCKDDFLYSEGKTFSCLCPRCPICIQDTQIILKERDSLTCQECNEYIRKDAIILPTISSLNYSLYSVWRANYSKWKRQLIKFENALEKNKDFPKESSIVLFNDIIIYYNEFISNPTRQEKVNLELLPISDRNLINVNDYIKVKNTIIHKKPNIIIIASAMKHIDKCENYVKECLDTNIIGLLNIINSINELKIYADLNFLKKIDFKVKDT